MGKLLSVFMYIHTYFYRTFLIMHDFIRVTHLHSAKFIDIQRLPELNFRIKFLTQMKSGTEVDMVHHWIKVCNISGHILSRFGFFFTLSGFHSCRPRSQASLILACRA